MDRADSLKRRVAILRICVAFAGFLGLAGLAVFCAYSSAVESARTSVRADTVVLLSRLDGLVGGEQLPHGQHAGNLVAPAEIERLIDEAGLQCSWRVSGSAGADTLVVHPEVSSLIALFSASELDGGLLLVDGQWMVIGSFDELQSLLSR